MHIHSSKVVPRLPKVVGGSSIKWREPINQLLSQLSTTSHHRIWSSKEVSLRWHCISQPATHPVLPPAYLPDSPADNRPTFDVQADELSAHG